MWKLSNPRLLSNIGGSTFKDAGHLLALSRYEWSNDLPSARVLKLSWSVARSYDGSGDPLELVIKMCSRDWERKACVSTRGVRTLPRSFAFRFRIVGRR